MTTKEHIVKLLEWIHEEVLFAGGDGDVWWILKNYSIDEIMPALNEVNDSLKFKWKIEVKEDYVFWGEHEEWVIIGKNIEVPSWAQCVITL